MLPVQVVNGDYDGAELCNRIIGGDGVDAVGQHQRASVADCQAHLLQSGCKAVAADIQFAVCDGLALVPNCNLFGYPCCGPFHILCKVHFSNRQFASSLH